jgi:hypothetical protein
MRLFILSIAILLSTSVFSQDSSGIKVIAYNTQDKVFIKWLPESYDLWVKGINAGYSIERFEMNEVAGKWQVISSKVLTSEPVKAWSLEKIQKELPNHPDLQYMDAMLAGEDMNNIKPDNIDDAVNLQSQKNLVFALGLYSLVLKNKTAEAAGSFFVDSTAQAGKIYLYRVSLSTDKSIKGEELVNRNKLSSNPAISGFDLIGVHKAVDLYWINRPGSGYIYYNIYRAESKKGLFVQLNDLPFIGDISGSFDEKRFKYADSVPDLNKTYYYKIAGINAFEKEGPPTAVLAGAAAYFLQRAPMVHDGEADKNQQVELAWDLYEEEKPHVKNISVYHATSATGNFVRVNTKPIAPEVTFFVDERKDKSNSNYYRVCAFGQAGDSVCSILKGVFLVDSIPPAPPIIVSGICDTNGIVTVKWKKGPERDMLGYRVFRTYFTHKEPNRLTVGYISDTVFVDTISIKSGYKKVYYGVAAIDQVYNASALSAYYTVLIPDKIPPVNALFTDYAAGYKGITLEWQTSTAEDIKTQYLYRKSELEFQWQTMAKFRGDSLNVSIYNDTLTKSNIWYEYKLVAVDSAGLSSQDSKILRIQQPEKDPFPIVENLRAIVNKENKMVKLSWDFNKNATGFRIMRAKKGEPLETYTFVKGSKREYYDSYLIINTEYVYSVVAEIPEGRKSLMSNKVEVKY